MEHWQHNNRNIQPSDTHPKDPRRDMTKDVEASLNNNE